MSTTARRYYLKLLHLLGVKSFVSRSGLNLPFVCYPGDFAGEVPFYAKGHSVMEISVMAAWCRTIEEPVIFDVGANNGFVACQLAQLLRGRGTCVYAFEPVQSTFAQLGQSVARLSLQQSVFPVCAAISDSAGITSLQFNRRNSLFAQMRNTSNPRVGSEFAYASMITLDEITSSLRRKPHLLKVDVEGSEARVFRGAGSLLEGDDAPAVFFEWNPLTLAEVDNDVSDLSTYLTNYDLFYVDDFEGGRLRLGEPIERLAELNWACNVIAVPKRSENQTRWRSTLKECAALT